MMHYTLWQVQNALGLEESRLNRFLSLSGVQPWNGLLSTEDMDKLFAYLTREAENHRLRSEQKLHSLVEQNLMMIDTCSLVGYFGRFWKNLQPILRSLGKQLVVPTAVVQELRSMGMHGKCVKEVIEAYNILSRGVRENLIKIYGESTDRFGDRLFLRKATELRETQSLLIITRDMGLAQDLLRLNETSSVRGKRITVCQINQYGYLSFIKPNGSQGRSGSGSVTGSRSGSGNCVGNGSGSSSKVFSAAPPTVLIPEDRTLISPAAIPECGSMVYTAVGQQMVLGERIGSGGEGTVYSLEDGSVAKIYRREKLTTGKKAKLEAMMSRKLNCPGICWPQELLYDADSCFVGYRMSRAEGVSLACGVFGRPRLETHFPQWSKTEMVRLCVTFLEKIQYLHQQGILLGDINGQNTLVLSPEQLWFVDCDSYQVGGHPCPVGNDRFTPPELQGKRFDSILRTEENERFAVAVLLFTMMLPGMNPYTQQDGESMSEAIRRMAFPYPCGDHGSSAIPAGDWRYLWSHLPRFLKESFYHTFQKDGKYSAPENRLTVEDWLKQFRRYLSLLESGKLQNQDPQSGLIFPNRYKMYEGSGGIAGTYVCVECGVAFDITGGEKQYFRSAGMPLPKRCPTCRNLRSMIRKVG